ncbi:uncharacterized protein LOC114281774 isoform X3 [Camellia sinensis]|uniref:uncharacterized protein LOC114281774 isoform X3 n=1 Tax=Camellia sinensis TaxID=4442 RepID=UPI00103627C3|nr:uncharacterized protein LOC114281774 isoform X3 [Camellia sinensis]
MVLLGAPPHRLGEMLTLLHLRQNCISDRTKYYPLASFVLHIKHSESKDSAVSPRILLSGPAVMSRSYKHCREVLEYLNWISSRVPQKIMSMFFMEDSGQPPKRLEVSRSSNGEDDEEWSLISEMHSRLEISWRDAKYGQRIQELNFASFFIF